MRNKRKVRFRKLRRKNLRKRIVWIVLMPSVLLLLGYLVASIIILPSMHG